MYKLFTTLTAIACVFTTPAYGIGTGSSFPIYEAKQAIEFALVEEGAGNNIKIEAVRLSVPGTSLQYNINAIDSSVLKDSYTLKNIDINHTNSSFLANLSAEKYTVNVSGRFAEYIEVPVVDAPIRKGLVLRKEDLRFVEMPSRKVHRDVVMELADLVGKEAVRSLRVSKPVRARDLRKPIMVDKGDVVTLLYSNRFIDLKTVGVALQKASLGEVIQVKNSKSGKIVQAMVNQRGEALVNYADRLGEQLAGN